MNGEQVAAIAAHTAARGEMELVMMKLRALGPDGYDAREYAQAQARLSETADAAHRALTA